MRIALIYTGQEWTWKRCRENHAVNVWGDADIFWHTEEKLGIPGDWYVLDGVSHPYDQRRRGETVVASSLNQWHKNFIGFSMVPRGYDVYVRIRPDIVFDQKIDFKIYNYEGLKVYIPHGHNYWGGVNDQIAWGNYETIKIYYSIYLNHLEIFNSGVEFHTERFLTENLTRSGVEIIRVPIDNHIIR